MRTLNRYIALRTLKAIVVAFLIVTGVIMLVDFVEATRNLDLGEAASPLKILYLTGLRTPYLVEQTIPFVVLFGVMGALYSLNRRSELIVLRAAGLSAWKFLQPVLIVTGLLGLIWTTLLNPLAARALTKYETTISLSQGKTAPATDSSDIWLREGTPDEQIVIYARSADLLNKTLYEVEFNVFNATSNGELEFTRRYDAKQAVLLASQYWQLTEAWENTASGETEYQSAISWPSQLSPDDLAQYSDKSASPQFWQLPAQIEKLKAAGFSTAETRMQFHKLLSLPLTLIAMSLIAAGVSMHLTREGGTFRLLLSGVTIGFTVFFVENIVKAFGESGAINVPFAVWIVPALVLVLGIVYLSKIEDG